MDARAFVQAVADKVRGGARAAPPIVYEEEFGSYTLTWENERLSCGVTAGETGACVFLAEASQEVGEPGEAIALLRGIFKDQVVVIAALQAGQVLFYDLTPAGDPTEEFVRFTGGDYFKAPAVDAVWVRSWTGAGDYGEPPTVADDLAAATAWPDVGMPAEEDAGPEWAAEAVRMSRRRVGGADCAVGERYRKTFTQLSASRP